MKNKILFLFCFSTLIISFYFAVPVHAETNAQRYSYLAIIKSLYSGKYAVYASYSNPIDIIDSTYSGQPVLTNRMDWIGGSLGDQEFSTIDQAIAYINSSATWYGRNNMYSPIVITIKGTSNYVGTNQNMFASYQDYLDSIAPKWYEVLWDDFKDFVSDLGLALLTPFDPNSILDIADWFENAWTVKVGEGEDDLLNQINVVSPTPTPIPPTPIPYQTVIVPDGNGGSIIQYKYLNPSGTPIITDQPPQQNVTVNYDTDNDNNFEYPYYENPENKDNPFKFKIPWYLKLVLRHNDIDIDTLDDHYQVAQNQVQSEDVVNAVNEVYNGFQVLPTDWLLLLGAIASIPLFAALIHRFLQG